MPVFYAFWWSAFVASTGLAWRVQVCLIWICSVLLQSSAPLPHINIGALFDGAGYTEHATLFNTTVSRNARHQGFTIYGSPMMIRGTIKGNYDELCWRMERYNFTVFMLFSHQPVINALSVVTSQVGVPALAYSTEKTALYIRGQRHLYLNLNPTRALLAKAIVVALEQSHWHYASVIVEDEYYMDGFVHTFESLTSGGVWHLEDKIRIARAETDDVIDAKLRVLQENKSRVIILHCSLYLARSVFRVAEENGLMGRGYAWFVTEDIITRDRAIISTFPSGLVGVSLDHSVSYDKLIPDILSFITQAVKNMQAKEPKLLQYLATSRSCWSTLEKTSQQARATDALYRHLRNTSIVGHTGEVSFDSDGIRTLLPVKFYNLNNQRRGNRKKWRFVGRFANDTFRVSTIIWPGDSVSGPITKGPNLLRVVTTTVDPFVMSQESTGGVCIDVKAVPCLKVDTRDKDTLDLIFRDFEKGIIDDSRPYDIYCCQGLSIMLLERLSKDIEFKYQLYIVPDGKHGSINNTGHWDGLVSDILHEAAHMAIAAFSITEARSSVIDFSTPYFFSGFSVLVAERKRNPPIYAWMEPFDGFVWSTIFISATVAAVAVSLLEWNSPFGLNPWGRKRKVNYTLGSGLNMVYAILFQHTVKTKSPKAWPSKWLQNFWAGVSIFIYSSYTANLAAFLAGKNVDVTVTDLHDPKLLAPERQVGVVRGTAIEEYVRGVHPELLAKTTRYSNITTFQAVEMLMRDQMDAFMDDTPILEYARATMDSKCELKLVDEGFGKDGYGIGLPRGSWLREPLTTKILQYHESGFMDELKDLFYSRHKSCNYHTGSTALQGEAAPMNFSQHAGLYLLLLVGVFGCILLMFLEHAVFKWLVPYWRSKPPTSFWKTYAMMFWSQRLYRIITSEELVSPQHTAREMIEVVKNREFAKLFQKSVKKQERQARNRKNLFSVVEQIQWKQRREERLSKAPSLADTDSEASTTPMNFLPRQGTSSEDQEMGLTDEASILNAARRRELYKAAHLNRSFSSQGDTLFRPKGPLPIAYRPVPTDITDTEESTPESPRRIPRPIRKRLISSDPEDEHPRDRSDVTVTDYLSDLADRAELHSSDDALLSSSPSAPRSHSPLAKRTSNSDGNLPSHTDLPNGVLILSPNGDVFARNANIGKNVHVIPKNTNGNAKNFNDNLPLSMKTLPLKDNRVKSNINRSRTLDKLADRTTNKIDAINIDSLSKEEIFMMWKSSERDLNFKLQQALKEKATLEKQLSDIQGDPVT